MSDSSHPAVQGPDIEHLVRYGGDFVPQIIARAEGARLYTSAGDEILDFTSGQMSSLLGHSHPAIVETVSRSAAT